MPQRSAGTAFDTPPRPSRAERRARARQRSEAPASKTGAGPALAELEGRLAALWEEVLGIPAPDADASFFDVGGDSLRLAELGRRIGRSFGRLSMVDLLRHPTITSLARHLASSGRAASPAPAPARTPPPAREGEEEGPLARQRRFMERRRALRGAGDAQVTWRRDGRDDE